MDYYTTWEEVEVDRAYPRLRIRKRRELNRQVRPWYLVWVSSKFDSGSFVADFESQTESMKFADETVRSGTKPTLPRPYMTPRG